MVALLAALAGCQGLGARSARSRTAFSTDTKSPRLELRELDDRPRIALVLRQGDPFAAVGAAFAHDAGSEASVALAALLEARLRAQFAGVETRPHQLGVQITSLVSRPEEATAFVTAVGAALRRPLLAGAPELLVIQKRLSALRARSVTGPSELAVAACSGELAIPTSAALVDPATPGGLARLESYRQAVLSSKSAGFAALGAEPVVEAAARALDDGEPWPNGEPLADAWPERDAVGVDGSGDGERRLALALRIDDPNRALEAAPLLGRATGPLAVRLDALDPPWEVERAIATARVRGACLRVDLRGPRADPGPRLVDVARVAATAIEEAELALGAVPSDTWTLEESVLRPNDPREAVAIAAWRAVTGQLPAGPPRRFVSFETRPAEAGPNASAQLGREIELARASAQRSGLERRTRLERGQGELWALLASPCGTRGESSYDSGLGALVMHTLASQRSRLDDVELEPWITADGIGILAHAPPRGHEETPLAQARRIGGAVGRALASRLSGGELARARERLLAAVGPGPRPAWWLTLDAIAPEHASWLEPRGSFFALSEAASQGADARRRAIVQGPLRLAVLANRDPAQTEAAAAAAERWIRGLRPEPTRCPLPVRIASRNGELVLQAVADVPDEAPAFVAVPLPTIEGALSREAEWMAFLLNRPTGWLEQALRASNGGVAARARVLGGSRASALVIEVYAAAENVRGAVAQVRGLLDRLSRAGVSSTEFEIARKHFEREGSVALLDPRRRIVDLWRIDVPRDPDPAALKRFLGALRPEAHVVVYLKPRE